MVLPQSQCGFGTFETSGVQTAAKGGRKRHKNRKNLTFFHFFVKNLHFFARKTRKCCFFDGFLAIIWVCGPESGGKWGKPPISPYCPIVIVFIVLSYTVRTYDD